MLMCNVVALADQQLLNGMQERCGWNDLLVRVLVCREGRVEEEEEEAVEVVRIQSAPRQSELFWAQR